MTRYRIIDTIDKDNERLIGDGVDRAVGEELVYLLEEVDE